MQIGDWLTIGTLTFWSLVFTRLAWVHIVSTHGVPFRPSRPDADPTATEEMYDDDEEEEELEESDED